jgi:hypothetical protein
MMLYRGDDIIEDQYLQKIALDDGIPHQVDPKSIPEKREALPVWRYPLPGDNEYHPADQYGCRYRY